MFHWFICQPSKCFPKSKDFSTTPIKLTDGALLRYNSTPSPVDGSHLFGDLNTCALWKEEEEKLLSRIPVDQQAGTLGVSPASVGGSGGAGSVGESAAMVSFFFDFRFVFEYFAILRKSDEIPCVSHVRHLEIQANNHPKNTVQYVLQSTEQGIELGITSQST